MAGPVIEAAKEVLGIEDEDTVRERLEEGGPLSEHREELNKRLEGSAGGCCNAAQAAEATRRSGKEFR